MHARPDELCTPDVAGSGTHRGAAHSGDASATASSESVSASRDHGRLFAAHTTSDFGGGDDRALGAERVGGEESNESCDGGEHCDTAKMQSNKKKGQ
jgi:hypothetical protein